MGASLLALAKSIYYVKHESLRLQGPRCSQFTSCIPLSKRKAKTKKKSGRSLCVSKKICVLLVYFTSKFGDKSGGI